MVKLMTVEKLLEAMNQMKVGDVINIAADLSNAKSVSKDAYDDAETWFGITKIDLSLFDVTDAFVIGYYGGGDERLVTRSDGILDEYVLADLKENLADLDVLQEDGKVAVECKLVPDIRKVCVT